MKPFWVILLLLASVGCSGNATSLTTDTSSRSLADLSARKAFAARYLALPGEVADLAFHIVYRDNSGGMVPGPSDWDIKVLVRDPAELGLWTKDLAVVEPPVEVDWVKGLSDWELGDVVEAHGREGRLVVRYRNGVVALRDWTR